MQCPAARTVSVSNQKQATPENAVSTGMYRRIGTATAALHGHLSQYPRSNHEPDTTTMPRELSERDIEILKKLAPECEGLTCSGSGQQFHSILPPVSNHFSADEHDFAERIRRLTDDELKYISGLILSGEESLGCLPEEDLESLLALITERLSKDETKKVIEAFASFGVCERS
jgi:hypothetical protein